MTTIIRKALIANRGEIACRIAQTCREMGIATVAVYSDADANALHVDAADEAVHIGLSAAVESYLDGKKLIDAAKRTGADAIHPGYGFLAENADFARAVDDAGLIFIGPPPSAIEAMGSKREAKLLLKDIPLLPGYSGEDQSDQAFMNAAEQIGYPVMVKAPAGGGGKGMRRVNAADGLPDALGAARRESKQAFGDETLILEKFVEQPRHVEIQIFGDQQGNVIAIGERECSIQRRHQKIIEETPSTAVDAALREKMSEVAVSIGKQLGYHSAGTVEFLLDSDGNFYFMEMNTRLQVEHPVTELVYGGLNLVEWQIRIAEGQPLPQTQFVPQGHAIEVRVYAENPAQGFLPTSGEILRWDAAYGMGLRYEEGIRTGDHVTTHYDPMLAKIIAWDETREGAIRRLDYALAQSQLLGVQNNIAFLRRVINHADFVAGEINTAFIEARPELLEMNSALPPVVLIAGAIDRQQTLQPGGTNWRNNPYRPIRHVFRHGDESHEVLIAPEKKRGSYMVQIAETTYAVQVVSCGDDIMTLEVDGHRQRVTAVHRDDTWWVHAGGDAYRLYWVTPMPAPGRPAAVLGSLRAPMPGQVISVSVEEGQHVKKGVILLTMEAMKMEHRIEAPYDGIVGVIHYAAGDSVQAEEILLEIKPEE